MTRSTILRALATCAAIAGLAFWWANGGWESRTAVLFIGTMWVGYLCRPDYSSPDGSSCGDSEA